MSTTTRLAGLVLAATAALGVASAPAQASAYAAELDCVGRTVQAPLIANPAQLNAVYWRVNGGQWNIHYIYSAGINSWKWTGAGWSYAGASGGFYLLPDYGRVEAWTYTWNVVNGQYVGAGWTALGAC